MSEYNNKQELLMIAHNELMQLRSDLHNVVKQIPEYKSADYISGVYWLRDKASAHVTEALFCVDRFLGFN